MYSVEDLAKLSWLGDGRCTRSDTGAWPPSPWRTSSARTPWRACARQASASLQPSCSCAPFSARPAGPSGDAALPRTRYCLVARPWPEESLLPRGRQCWGGGGPPSGTAPRKAPSLAASRCLFPPWQWWRWLLLLVVATVAAAVVVVPVVAAALGWRGGSWMGGGARQVGLVGGRAGGEAGGGQAILPCTRSCALQLCSDQV